MKAFLALSMVFLGMTGAAAVMHSWKAFYTTSTGLSEFPEFVALNLLDDELMGYFDSRTNRFESRQSWMKENLGQAYDTQETNILQGTSQSFKANVQILMERFNQSKGAHIVQYMYGCEWDDETNEVNGFRQHGYDGEDFLVQDMKTETWIAPVQQAVITKLKWEKDQAEVSFRRNYITQICPEALKKYVNYGRSSLMRKELPLVSLLQKSPSSPVTCHATGFYPDRADLFWMKDGEELHENVEKGEILPNHDGTFQMSVDLKISSIKPEDWQKYDCVFQLSGVKDDINTKLDKAVIKTNRGNSLAMIIPIVAAVVILAAIAVGGFIVYKKKKDKRPPSPVENKEVREEMLPQA